MTPTRTIDLPNSGPSEESAASTFAAGASDLTASSDLGHPTAGYYRGLVSSFNDSLAVAEYFEQVATKAGDVVKTLCEYAYLPIMFDRDQLPVPLYFLVDVIDEVLDYKEIQRQIPSLSIGQVAGGVKFLRRLSQFNVRGLDLDDVERDLLVDMGCLPSQLSFDLCDQETTRVLGSNPEKG